MAAELARRINALAFTSGTRIGFRHAPDLRLAAHEAAHVIQQRAGVSLPDNVGRPGDRWERHADQVADAVVAGRSAGSLLDRAFTGFANQAAIKEPSSALPTSSVLQRACGAAEIGSVGGCTPRGGDVTDFAESSEFLFMFKTGCDELLPGELERALEFSDQLTPFDHIEVDGFASEEGPPYFNENLSCARAHVIASLLSPVEPHPPQIDGLYSHGATPGMRMARRSAVVSLWRWPRAVQPEEQNVLDRLRRLADIVASEATAMTSIRHIWRAEGFARGVRKFQMALEKRLKLLQEGEPLPDDVRFVMEALMLWSKDRGNQWGEGIWDSKDLVMSASDYATVPAGQYKCNAYVAEVAYRSLGVVQRVYESEEQPGRFFPYRASDWGNVSLTIPHFPVVSTPQMGDVWSNGSHIGIFLGTYEGNRLYISARDDGSGVWGLRSQIQHEHGIQIKVLRASGIYRRYTSRHGGT